jgi:hypothetical protein
VDYEIIARNACAFEAVSARVVNDDALAAGVKPGRALAMTEGDASLSEIVRRQFHGDLVPGQNPDTVAAQAAGQVGQDDTVMLQLNAEQTTGKLFKYGSGYFNAIFFTQRLSLVLFSPIRQPAVIT